jgi:uncharacterized protein YdaL
MLTLLGSLLGFLGSIVPDVFKMLQDRSDRNHELKIMDLQMQREQQGHNNRLEEINASADIAETKAIYKTYKVGIRWVDALNGTVRPVIAYAFFGLYAFVKFQQSIHTPWLIWSASDEAIFAGIISFYFGQRAMSKVRQGK